MVTVTLMLSTVIQIIGEGQGNFNIFTSLFFLNIVFWQVKTLKGKSFKTQRSETVVRNNSVVWWLLSGYPGHGAHRVAEKGVRRRRRWSCYTLGVPRILANGTMLDRNEETENRGWLTRWNNVTSAWAMLRWEQDFKNEISWRESELWSIRAGGRWRFGDHRHLRAGEARKRRKLGGKGRTETMETHPGQRSCWACVEEPGGAR